MTEATGEFLVRAAAGGGSDVVHPVDQPVSEHPAAAVQEESSKPFLRPVGVRDIGEVEAPEWKAQSAPMNRSVAAGIGPENPADDLKAPAYTRKYMD